MNKCRICGRTDEQGCLWILDDLCSTCADNLVKNDALSELKPEEQLVVLSSLEFPNEQDEKYYPPGYWESRS